MSLSVSVEKLDRHNLTGAIVITVAAVIAMVFVSLTLLHMLFAMAIPAYGRRMSNPQERRFVTSPLGLYIICLFISNLVSSLGGVMEGGWASAAVIVQGPACTTQAFMLQLGGNAAALWTAFISMSALSTFMFRARSLPKLAALPMIVLLWVAMIVFDAVASMIFADRSKQFFYGIAGMWCWITPSHPLARLFTQYVWMWVWSLISAVCFLLVLLCVRGNIEVKRDDHGRRTFKWIKRSSSSVTKRAEEYQGLVSTVGKTMCWFPISYITLTVPMSVSRIAETFGFPVPAYAFVFAAVNFLLIGVINSIIYIALRHSLKHSSGPVSPDATLRGSFSGSKFGHESFEVSQEKRPSPVNKTDPYPWTPTPTTTAWVPPSPHRGVGDATSPPSSAVAYAMTSGDDSTSAYRTSIVSNSPPRQVPVSSKMAQRSRSFHRPMESISTVTSSATVMGHSVSLSPVSEVDSATEPVRPELTLPPAALVPRSPSSPSPNIMSPADLDKLAYVPLSPGKPSGHKRADTEGSVYTGPRAISPDLNALLEATEAAYVPTGPPPPPRKARRSPTPSVPVDVDESDQGSFTVSPKPSMEEFDSQDIRPMSIGDITARPPVQRADSMRTFWAAYEEPSWTSNMPLPADAASLKRDTMRTFWAAYEGSSPTTPDMPMPVDAASMRRDTVLSTKDWKPSVMSPQDFRPVDSSVFLKPAISAVGRAPASARSENLSPESIYNKPAVASRVLAEHRRSRSSNAMPTAPAPAVTSTSGTLRPATSAIARYGSPGLALREGPSRNTPTPTSSDTNYTSDMSYRMPRPQPGYV